MSPSPNLKVLFLAVVLGAPIGVGFAAAAESDRSSSASITTTQETLLEKICRKIWPICPSDRDLMTFVAQATDKGTSDADASLYLIDVEARTVSEWSADPPVADPIVCPKSKRLFYRSGRRLMIQDLGLNGEGIHPEGMPRPVENVSVTAVFGCTSDASQGESDASQGEVVWVASLGDAGNGLRALNVTPSGKIGPVPHDALSEAMQDPQAPGQLRLLHGIRPDGYRIWVTNDTLLAQPKAASDPSPLLDFELSPHFVGSPAWIGDTQFLFATGLRN